MGLVPGTVLLKIRMNDFENTSETVYSVEFVVFALVFGRLATKAVVCDFQHSKKTDFTDSRVGDPVSSSSSHARASDQPVGRTQNLAITPLTFFPFWPCVCVCERGGM